MLAPFYNNRLINIWLSDTSRWLTDRFTTGYHALNRRLISSCDINNNNSSIQREKIRAWSEFADQKAFTAPVSMQEWTKRLVKNVEHYQANYIITFLVLMIYCVLTSPLLLIALAVSATGEWSYLTINQLC